MINDRVDLLIQEISGGNKRAFSQKIGVSATVIENIVGSRKGKPSFDVLEKIMYAIENINADWLLTGRGSMLKLDEPSSNNQFIKGNSNNMVGGNGNISVDDKESKQSSTIIAEYNERLNKQEQYIQSLLEEQKSLHQQISKLIDKLK